jgi:hypothetical protein
VSLTQRCPRCVRNLPAAFWTTSGWGKVGAYCRPCRRAIQAEEHALALTIYGGACAECGSHDRLHLDHIHRDGHVHRIFESAASMYRRIARAGQPIPEFDLQVLCIKHHAVKTSSERRSGPRSDVDPALLARIPIQRRGNPARSDVEAAVRSACLAAQGPVRLGVVAALLAPAGLDERAQKLHADVVRKHLDALAKDPESKVRRPRWGMYDARPTENPSSSEEPR